MSISETKVGTVEPTAASAFAEEPNFVIPSELRVPRGRRHHPKGASPYRSISDRELTLVQLSCDFICACIALPVALVVLSAMSSVPTNAPSLFGLNIEIDSFFPIAVVLALAFGGIYRVSHRQLQPSAFLEFRELSFGVGCGCVLTLAVGSFFHAAFGTIEPIATQLVAATIVAIGTITLGRIGLRFFLHALTTTRVLVVGAGKSAERIMMNVRHDPGMTLVGRVVDGDVTEAGALGRVADLPHLCRELDVHRILVAASDEFSDQSLDTYRDLQEFVHIAMVPHYYELISWRSRLTDLGGMPFLEIAQPHLSPWDRFMKRAFDLFISAAVLLVCSPILLVVAIGVKLSSPGPVFFRQVRLGRYAQPFMVNKFRSMTTDTGKARPMNGGHDDHGQTDRPLHEVRNKHDESWRITRFGAFLRRTGIDEIPQFINVFKGEMSVVGPRPFIPSESQMEGWGVRRFEVRPGITGLWQVSGRNDLTRSDLVQLDYLYVASWSMWWDLKIMFETPKTMARGTGAY
jgi:exopolysaccharide biosynthesis polyprenyl glycosylphosphotransferase